jgi:DNA-binding LacI/PurR family transcriptional regulator
MIDKKFQIAKINKNSAFPLANQLARQLTWLIADGVIAKGEKLPSIREYAQYLEIHHHTVRAAYHQLEERDLVSVRPGIGTMVQKYTPFISIPHTDHVKKDLIAVLVPGLSEFYQEIISGIEDVAFSNRLIPVVLNCHDDSNFAEATYKLLSARNITGIINISLGFSDEFHENFLNRDNLNIPLLFLDVIDAGTHSLTIDTASAIALAAAHLLDHDYVDVALMTCPVDWPIGREALKGFQRAFEARGLSLNENSVFSIPNFGYQAGRFIIERMLQDHTLPRAIVAVSDNMAIGAISALKENGLSVPQDVAIIGFNDILPASFIDPPLSTIGLPLYDMGKLAMLSLNTILSGKVKSWIHKRFSGRLVIRKSCGC